MAPNVVFDAPTLLKFWIIMSLSQQKWIIMSLSQQKWIFHVPMRLS